MSALYEKCAQPITYFNAAAQDLSTRSENHRRDVFLKKTKQQGAVYIALNPFVTLYKTEYVNHSIK